jgi:Domain of unknown function (DUF4861)
MKNINHKTLRNSLWITLFVIISAIMILCTFSGCISGDRSGIRIEVTNNSTVAIKDAVIRINEPMILQKINSMSGKHIIVKSDTICPVQLITKKNKTTELLFLCDLGPAETKEFIISKSGQETAFKQRTQAELSIKAGGQWKGRIYEGGKFKNVTSLRVPDEHTDHSFYIRYEGPGWESDKIGYRFYLDWRNAIDIFGKKVDTLVLQNVGQDGFESYHEISPWGVDVLKVGESLGIGTIGYWTGKKAERVALTDSVFCEINYSGIIESKITTTYYGWKVGNYQTTLISKLSIQAGSRMTRHDLETSIGMDNLCTGIVKLPDTEYIVPESAEGQWTWMATYGKQSLQNDSLGMAIIYRTKDLITLTEDEDDHVIVLQPSENKVTYYLLAAWEQEPGGIKSKHQFVEYLNKQVEVLNKGVVVKY